MHRSKARSRAPQVPKKNDGHVMKRQVNNERVRVQTQLEKIDLIIKERRLRWLGHVLGMVDTTDCQDKLYTGI